jgi:hypothetical protein
MANHISLPLYFFSAAFTGFFAFVLVFLDIPSTLDLMRRLIDQAFNLNHLFLSHTE